MLCKKSSAFEGKGWVFHLVKYTLFAMLLIVMSSFLTFADESVVPEIINIDINSTHEVNFQPGDHKQLYFTIEKSGLYFLDFSTNDDRVFISGLDKADDSSTTVDHSDGYFYGVEGTSYYLDIYMSTDYVYPYKEDGSEAVFTDDGNATISINISPLDEPSTCEIGGAVKPKHIETKSNKYQSGYYAAFDISEPGWYLVSIDGEAFYEEAHTFDEDGNYIPNNNKYNIGNGSFTLYVHRFEEGRYWVRIEKSKKIGVSRIPDIEPGQKIAFNMDPLNLVAAAIMTTETAGQYYIAQEAEVTNNHYYTFEDESVINLNNRKESKLKYIRYYQEKISYKKYDRLKDDCHTLSGGPLYKKCATGSTFEAKDNGVYLYIAYTEGKRGIKVCPMLTAGTGGNEFRTNLKYASVVQMVDCKCKTIYPINTAFSTNKDKLFSDDIILSGNTLKRGKDFTVTFSNRNVGKSKVTLKGKGNFTGKLEYTTEILPLGTNIKSAKASGNSIKVTWNKQSAKMAKTRIEGYQIQYSTNKYFASDNHKEKKVKGYNKTSTVLKGLKKGKTYYLRICTYKKVGNKYYYSPWNTYIKLPSGLAKPIKVN